MRLTVLAKRFHRKLATPGLLLVLLLLCILYVFPKYFKDNDIDSIFKEKLSFTSHRSKPPGKVLILSSYRSGSSLMGELVATTSTRTMYEFEPTYHAFVAKNKGKDENERGQLCTDILKTMFNCSAQYTDEMIEQLIPYRFFSPTSYQVMKIFNTEWDPTNGGGFYWEQNPTDKEELKKYVRYTCAQSTFKLIKTIRLPVLDFYNMYHTLYTLLETFDDLVIIGMVRDPRDSFASRKKFGGGPGFEQTPTSLNDICQNYSSIISFVRAISNGLHADRVALVKYEEFYNSPIQILTSTFARLAIPVPQRTIEYIKANVMNENGGDLENTAKHGLFTKPRDKNATIGYWKTIKMDPAILEQSSKCIEEYEQTKSTVLDTAV